MVTVSNHEVVQYLVKAVDKNGDVSTNEKWQTFYISFKNDNIPEDDNKNQC